MMHCLKNIERFGALLLASIVCVTSFAQVSSTLPDDTHSDPADTKRQVEIAMALWQAGHILRAENIFNSAYDHATTNTDKLLAAEKVSNFYIAANEHPKAIKAYENLLGDEEIKNDTLSLVAVYEGIGHAYHADAQYIRSIKNYRKAEKLLATAPDSALYSSLYTNMARTLMMAGDMKEATRLVAKAKKFANKEDAAQYAEILNTESDICSQQSFFRLAYTLKDSAMQLHKDAYLKEVYKILNTTNPVLLQQKEDVRTRFQLESDELRAQIEDVKNTRDRAIMTVIIMCLVCGASIVAYFITYSKLYNALRKNRKLEQTNKDSERVISIVAHDSTNQFATLLGFAEILMNKTKDSNTEEAEFSKLIFSSSQKLYQMMSNLLAWSKTKGQMKPRRTLVDVKKNIDNAIATLEISAHEKQISINNTVSESTVAMVDSSHLDIILRNIIANAIKFTRKDGQVKIYAIMHGDKTSIMIEDNGVGMNPEAVNKFNNDLVLSSTEGTDFEEGNGLGLSICRELAHSNGGDIIIESGYSNKNDKEKNNENKNNESKNNENKNDEGKCGTTVTITLKKS